MKIDELKIYHNTYVYGAGEYETLIAYLGKDKGNDYFPYLLQNQSDRRIVLLREYSNQYKDPTQEWFIPAYMILELADKIREQTNE